MRVGDITRRRVVRARYRDSLADAAEAMLAQEVGSLAVFDGHRFVGILTERDLLRALADGCSPRVTEVGTYMSAEPAVAHTDEDSAAVARRMLEAGVRHLPLLDAGAVVGMVSARDLLVLEAWPTGEGAER